jgi:hypothetical protein
VTRGHGGRGGIRTHGSFHFTRFPSVPIRPLSHPSSVLLRRRGRLPRWYGESLSVDECVSGEVPVGSCATVARETGQGRKTAAFSGHDCVPQIAWPSPHCLCAWCDTVHALGATLFMRLVRHCSCALKYAMRFHLHDQQDEDFPLVSRLQQVQTLVLAISNPQHCRYSHRLTHR